VYDMYPWDSDSQGDYPPEPLRSWKAPAPVETSPAHPVQVALDRRDNGGDALAAASQVAASQVAPGQPATPLIPGRTRQ
jgi:hypothetical protein